MSSRIEPADERPTFDVVVIGGGVNGTGVARDCALRGMKVALFEKHDWGFGASGNSSGMIHGGARYLTDHPGVTATSCQDSGYIQQIAPHLVFRIPFLMPIPEKGLASRVMLAAVDAFFAFYDRYQPLKRGKPHTLLTADEARTLEPGLGPAIRGAVSFDEWGIDGTRLCVANVLDAQENGAVCAAHHEVIEILHDPIDHRARGVVARDRETGAKVVATAKRVVNATGAWSPVTARLAGDREGKRAAVKLRPGKGIHVHFDRRIGNYAIVCKAIDGRQIFSMPWQNLSYLGTTDDDYYGDLDDVRATTDEVRYLVEAAARMLPEVAQARIIGTTAGVRPTLYEYGPYEDQLSREHEILDHTEDGVAGLYSMVGGKLASYRIFAEEMTDRLALDLDVRARGRTHELPLPGGGAEVDPLALAERLRISEPAARRLAYRQGTRVETITARIARDRDERAVVCACEPVIEAEVRHAIVVEGARDVADVARRTRLGLGACGGMRCAHRCAQIVAGERHLPPSAAHAMAAEFLVQRFRARVVALEGASVQMEALAMAKHLEAGLGAAGVAAWRAADPSASRAADPSASRADASASRADTKVERGE